MSVSYSCLYRTPHQELPTRTHPDHCRYGSQQPDCHKARLLQQPSGMLNQTLDKLQRAVLQELYTVVTVAIM